MTESPRNEITRSPTRFLRLPEVLERTGLSRSTIYVRRAEGKFPRPVSLGGRAVGWVESEMDDWIEERIGKGRLEGVRAGERGEAAPGIPEAGRRAAEVSSAR